MVHVARLALVLAFLLLEVPAQFCAWCIPSGPIAIDGGVEGFVWDFSAPPIQGKGDCHYQATEPPTCGQRNNPCSFTWSLTIITPYANARVCNVPLGGCGGLSTTPVTGGYGFAWNATDAPLACGGNFWFSLEVEGPLGWISVGSIWGLCQPCPSPPA